MEQNVIFVNYVVFFTSFDFSTKSSQQAQFKNYTVNLNTAILKEQLIQVLKLGISKSHVNRLLRVAKTQFLLGNM